MEVTRIQPKTIGAAVAVIRKLRQGGSAPWVEKDDEDDRYYSSAFEYLTDEQAIAVTNYCAENLTFRPSLAELLDVIVKVIAPCPDDDRVYAEIAHRKLEGIKRPIIETEVWERDAYGKKHSRPARIVDTEGCVTPEFSHPIVRNIVEMMGGWEAICNQDAERQEGLKKQAKDCWASEYTRYRAEVIQQLKEGRYAPHPYVKYALPGEAEYGTARALEKAREAKAIEAATGNDFALEVVPGKREGIEAMPTKAKELIGRIVNSTSFPKP